MQMKLVAALVAVASAAAGCAGTPFSWEDTAKVKNGMSEAEVVAILGKPYQRIESNGQLVVMTWSFATGFGGARAASYRFQDGRVVGSTTLGK